MFISREVFELTTGKLFRYKNFVMLCRKCASETRDTYIYTRVPFKYVKNTNKINKRKEQPTSQYQVYDLGICCYILRQHKYIIPKIYKGLPNGQTAELL